MLARSATLIICALSVRKNKIFFGSMVSYLQFEIASAIIFAIILAVFVFSQRKKIVIDKILFPFLYLVRWKTKLGIKSMTKYGSKYKGLIQLFGYSSIGIAVLGLLWIFISLFYGLYLSIVSPGGAASVSLVLPFKEVPGLGMLGFWHWIIAIFLLAIVHEFSHGIVAASHDIPVKNSGPAIFGVILPFLPAAYVEPDEEIMQKKPAFARYSIIAAGPVSNIIFGLIFFVILLVVLNPIEASISEPIAFSFQAVDDNSPAGKVLGTEKAVFDQIDNVKIVDGNDFYQAIIRKNPGETITLTNSKESKSYNITLEKHPESEIIPYIGIKSIQTERKFLSEMQGSIFSWFRNLVKWLSALNIFIGIANLLPLGPIDGGQFLRVFLHEVFPNDKNKAQRWWMNISFITLLLLILGFLGPSLF